MRIAMFTDCYHPVINGVVTSISLLKKALEEEGHEVLLFTHDYPGFEEREPNVYRFRSVHFPLMKENRFTFPWPLGPVGMLARRRVEAVHIHTPFNVGFIGLLTASWLGRPRFFTHHTLWEEYTHYVPLPTWFMKLLALGLCRTFGQSSAAVISPSEEVKQRLREQGITRPIHVIPTGIDTASFQGGNPAGPTEELELQAGQRLFVYVGRLAREKSIDFLLETLASRPMDEVRLAVIGDGPQRAELERHARQLGLDGRVRFLGYRPRSELKHYLAAARGLVFASQTETQGLVLLEAQAAGVPVLAVRGPGVTEAVDDG
ncbi:MAG: glycosyltransferase, partial [Candidatus Eremiobacterota bacterium]